VILPDIEKIKKFLCVESYIVFRAYIFPCKLHRIFYGIIHDSTYYCKTITLLEFISDDDSFMFKEISIRDVNNHETRKMLDYIYICLPFNIYRLNVLRITNLL